MYWLAVLKKRDGREAKVAGTIRINWLVERVRGAHQPDLPATYLFNVVDSTSGGDCKQFFAAGFGVVLPIGVHLRNRHATNTRVTNKGVTATFAPSEHEMQPTSLFEREVAVATSACFANTARSMLRAPRTEARHDLFLPPPKKKVRQAKSLSLCSYGWSRSAS